MLAAERTKPLDFRRVGTRRLRAAVFARDGFTCQRCGWRPKDREIPLDYDGRYAVGAWPHIAERVLHMDHIVPRVRGGPSALTNLWTLCDRCNVRKGATA